MNDNEIKNLDRERKQGLLESLKSKRESVPTDEMEEFNNTVNHFEKVVENDSITIGQMIAMMLIESLPKEPIDDDEDFDWNS